MDKQFVISYLNRENTHTHFFVLSPFKFESNISLAYNFVVVWNVCQILFLSQLTIDNHFIICIRIEKACNMRSAKWIRKWPIEKFRRSYIDIKNKISIVMKKRKNANFIWICKHRKTSPSEALISHLGWEKLKCIPTSAAIKSDRIKRKTRMTMNKKGR